MFLLIKEETEELQRLKPLRSQIVILKIAEERIPSYYKRLTEKRNLAGVRKILRFSSKGEAEEWDA